MRKVCSIFFLLFMFVFPFFSISQWHSINTYSLLDAVREVNALRQSIMSSRMNKNLGTQSERSKKPIIDLKQSLVNSVRRSKSKVDEKVFLSFFYFLDLLSLFTSTDRTALSHLFEYGSHYIITLNYLFLTFHVISEDNYHF